MTTPGVLLQGTPYLMPEDPASLRAFNNVAQRARETADRARQSQAQIGQEAEALLEPFYLAQRSDLVAESNQIEGYDVSRRQVQEAAEIHKELLDGPVHALLEVLRADPKIVTALGLFKAQQIADEWAHRAQRPQAYELRQLHSLITADQRFGGALRTFDVAIGGTRFRPPAHYDVRQAMDNFVAWWQTTTGDPILDAAVAHAWLTHIHPFEDGNGRLARVLANMVLANAGYPPLIVRAAADRGEYYLALAESDDGNILPLYQLFAQIVRRTAKVMAAPGYVRDVLEDRLLRGEEEQRAAWCAVATSFRRELRASLDLHGWSIAEQGLPDVASFSLLARRDADGNGWMDVVRDADERWRWLLWFGYNSAELVDLHGGKATGYPSLFISRKAFDPHASHPFIWEPGQLPGLPDELLLRPLEAAPVLWREGFDSRALPVPLAASRVSQALTSGG